MLLPRLVLDVQQERVILVVGVYARRQGAGQVFPSDLHAQPRRHRLLRSSYPESSRPRRGETPMPTARASTATRPSPIEARSRELGPRSVYGPYLVLHPLKLTSNRESSQHL